MDSSYNYSPKYLVCNLTPAKPGTLSYPTPGFGFPNAIPAELGSIPIFLPVSEQGKFCSKAPAFFALLLSSWDPKLSSHGHCSYGSPQPSRPLLVPSLRVGGPAGSLPSPGP